MSIAVIHDSCNLCQLSIGIGTGRWTGREPDEHWHYGCAETAGLTTITRVTSSRQLPPQLRYPLSSTEAG
jgi:hypothetical protein